MADVKWIKLTTSIFENRKIRQIETLPDGDAIIVIWVKLLCLAGNINDSGFVYFTKEIPYTEQMLATQFNRPLPTVQLALQTFEQFGMVEIVDNMLLISNWEKYQSVDRLQELREYNRLAKQKSRAKQKLLEGVNDKSMTSQQCQDTDIDKEKEIELDKNKNIDYEQIKDLFNDICKSFPRLTVLSDNRKKTIKARLNKYSVEEVKKMFEKAEASDFLKGSNNRDWQANFDWLMKDSNFAKVLDGNYDNKKEPEPKESKQQFGGVYL